MDNKMIAAGVGILVLGSMAVGSALTEPAKADQAPVIEVTGTKGADEIRVTKTVELTETTDVARIRRNIARLDQEIAQRQAQRQRYQELLDATEAEVEALPEKEATAK